MTPVIPPPLTPDQPISVVLPAGSPEPDLLDRGLAVLRTRYDAVITGENSPPIGYFSAEDAVRRKALQGALDDSRFGAVISARGGYGSSRIIDQLRFDKFLCAPKWVVGSSDITAVLFHLWCRYGVESIHGPMVAGLADGRAEDFTALVNLLEGKKWAPPMGLYGVSGGRATGPLIGGNLTVLAHLAGTIGAETTEGAILFLEDVGESPYRLDRCLTQLLRSHILDGVVGFVLGEWVQCEPGKHGICAMDVMQENLVPLGVPIAAGYPAAHGNGNFPFIHGRKMTLEIDSLNNVYLF